MPVLLGAIADDFSGATDLANTLVRQGMCAVQLIGVPTRPAPEDVDAVVVALKSRTIPPADAVAQSLASLGSAKRDRRRRGARLGLAAPLGSASRARKAERPAACSQPSDTDMDDALILRYRAYRAEGRFAVGHMKN